MTVTPPDGTVYLASDNQWYRWPDPRPYPSQDAAERQARPVRSTGSPYAQTMPYAGAPWTAEPTVQTGVGRAMGYLAVLFVGLPFVVAGVAWLLLPHDVEGGCEGIGFGCTLSPADTAVLLAFASLVVTVPGLAVIAIGMTLWARRSPTYAARSPQWKAGTVVAVVAVLAAIRGAAELAYRASNP